MGSETARPKRRRVLVVDDDPGVLQILEVNLVHANFEVLLARTGTEALGKAASEKPDLILLDVMLPDLDGFNVCRRLKQSQQMSHIPVIIISARVESKDRMAGLAAGAEHYVTKPFAPTEVVALVKACFQRLEQAGEVHPLKGLARGGVSRTLKL
ncbi:response regulator transcription factor [Chloroflexota bacterium]